MIQLMARRKQQLSPPYAPWAEMRETLEKLRGVRPSRVDIAFLQTYGIAPRNERTVINALKYLEIIDSEGVPTDRLMQLQGGEYVENLGRIVKQAYTNLFERINLKDATLETIHNYFLTQGAAPSVAAKCGRFFIGICKEAGIEISLALATTQSGGRRRLLPAAVKSQEQRKRRRPRSRAEREDAVSALLEAKLRLFEKLPKFDASWKPETIELVFKEFHRLADRLEARTGE